MWLTDEEIEELKRTKSEAEWDTLLTRFKVRRGGQVPGDWYQKVHRDGLKAQVSAKWQCTETERQAAALAACPRKLPHRRRVAGHR